MSLTPEKIIELESLFIEKNWKIEKEEEKFASVFNRFCKRLGIYDEEKQNLILELTADFLNVPLNDLYEYFINSIKKIENLKSYSAIIVCPLKSLKEKKTKSSDHLWYHLKNFCDFSYETFKDKLKFISEWKKISIEMTKGTPLIILVDDYIGSGKTVNDTVEELRQAGNLKEDTAYCIISLIATEIGVKNINEKYGDIVACDKIIRRGISDKYNGQILTENIKLMIQIEDELKVMPDFKFGYSQSESLVAIQNKAPNNTFPVFWLEKGGVSLHHLKRDNTMQEEVKLLLLKLVKSNGNLQPIIDLGYEYSQIINFLNFLTEEKSLIKEKNKVTITEFGLNEIQRLNKKFNRYNSAQWIEPKTESRISPIEKDFIYLPNRNELSF
jgi:hypothetical protein